MFQRRKAYTLRLRNRTLQLGSRTLIMGVVNVTPDSFSDGGRFCSTPAAVEHGLRMAGEGADIIDVGGESTRPGAEPVSTDVELERVIPVIEHLRRHSAVPISVDTTKCQVARAALEAGADLVNDISAFRFEAALAGEVARAGAAIVLVHSRGVPRTMQALPPSPDILSDVVTALSQAVEHALNSEISRDRIILDPGIGFGKTAEDNLRILQRLSFLRPFDLPVLVGTSRKSFIGKILDLPHHERLWGTAATVAASILGGAHLVRVHDVAENRQVCQVIDAILEQDSEPRP